MTALEKALQNLSAASDSELRKLYAKKKTAEKKDEEPVNEDDLALLERSLQKE